MKRGYHRLLLPDSTLIEGPVVVETAEDGSFCGWHRLSGEEPSVVWTGGEYAAATDNKQNNV